MKHIETGSIRSFGILFFLVFVIVALYPILNSQDIRIWSLLIGFILLTLGILKSPILKPFNLIWFKFGFFLGKFIAPIIMVIVYFTVVFPTSLLVKLFKKNYLNIKYEKNIISYWIKIIDKNTTMKDQF